MEPMETKALNPTISRKLQSRTAVQSAPHWLMKPTLPGLAMVAAKVALTPMFGIITPRQFGPTMRMLPRARLGENLPFELHACRPGFLEAGGNDDGAADAGLDAILDDAGDGLGRRANHREVHLFRNGADVRICLDAQDGGALGIDRINDAVKPAAAKILE